MKSTLAKRIAYLRNLKNLTQEQLADLTGLTRGRINNYEQGIREPDLGIIQNLATFFNVSVDYLIGFSEKPQSVNEEIATYETTLEKLIKQLSNDERRQIESYIKYLISQRN